MKTSLRFAVILFILCGLAACQQSPATTPEQAAEPTSPPTLQTETPSTAEPEGSSEIVQFYESTDAADDAPQVWLYIDPGEEGPVPVKVNCDGVESYVNAPSDGVQILNHCILQTGKASAHAVLPDGSIVSIAPFSRIQINLAEGKTEVILEEGEVYFVVAPQGYDRTFSVLLADSGLEALGTRFGVSLKDKLINVVVFEGKVITHRCMMWRMYTCMKWDQVSVEFLPGYAYSNTVGEIDWTIGNKYNPDNMVPDPTLPASGHLEQVMRDYMFADGTQGGLYYHYDEDNLYLSRLVVNGYFFDQLWPIMGMDDYNELVSIMNDGMSDYCNTYPDNCPIPTPFAPIDDVPASGGNSDQPGTSGSATCSNCPQFDQSSCFTRSGHMWCFPVAGTVDPAMSAEWDITDLCASYPGETFCSWLP